MNWFWSLTLCDDETTAMIPIPLKLYSLGDRTPGFTLGEDGSVTIYLQHVSAGAETDPLIAMGEKLCAA